MNYSCHGSSNKHGNSNNFDDSTCDLSVSSLAPDSSEAEGNHASLVNFSESLDMDRHISTQRPARELVLRQVRGEGDGDDDFGESFALDDSKDHLLPHCFPAAAERRSVNVSAMGHLLSISDDITEVEEDEDFAPKATTNSEAVSA
jgi:hypothetical protein